MKTTKQILYDKGLFDKFRIADKVSEKFLFTTKRKVDLEKVNDVVQWFFWKKYFEVFSNIQYKNLSNPLFYWFDYLRDGPFESDTEIVNLHQSKSIHWVCYINEKYFDSYGCVCPKKLSKFLIQRNGCCLYSDIDIKKMIVFVQVITYI